MLLHTAPTTWVVAQIDSNSVRLDPLGHHELRLSHGGKFQITERYAVGQTQAGDIRTCVCTHAIKKLGLSFKLRIEKYMRAGLAVSRLSVRITLATFSAASKALRTAP